MRQLRLFLQSGLVDRVVPASRLLHHNTTARQKGTSGQSHREHTPVHTSPSTAQSQGNRQMVVYHVPGIYKSMTYSFATYQNSSAPFFEIMVEHCTQTWGSLLSFGCRRRARQVALVMQELRSYPPPAQLQRLSQLFHSWFLPHLGIHIFLPGNNHGSQRVQSHSPAYES